MEVYDKIVGTIEQVFSPLGLMSGDGAILKRFALGAVLGGVVVVLIKPSAMFDDAGNARPWSFLMSEGQQQLSTAAPTSIPWITGPIIGALIFGAFI